WERGAEDGHHGSDIDDLAATLLLHDGVAGTAREEGAGQVDVDDLAPLGEGEVLDGLADVHASVVDEDVEPAEALDGRLDEGIDKNPIGTIHTDGLALCSSAS